MKRWPLRWKLAFYAAALAVVATLAGAGTTWMVILSIDPEMKQVNRIGWDILFGMLGAIPTVLIVIAVGGRWVAKQALAPVEAISQAASRISVHNLDQRLPVPSTADEIADLVVILNTTLDRLQRSFEQSVRFSAEASHHLKTPISVLRAGIEEILTDPDTPAKQQARADALLHQIHQLTSIAENLLLLARADAGRLDLHRERFDLSDVLRGMCEDASAMAETEGLDVETKLPPELPVVADRRAVSLIVQNLLENAIKYNQPEGCIRIYAHAVNGVAEVTVRSNGEPIPPERAPHIFERFYRARSDGRISGQGLGLTIACELAKAHDGRLELVRSDREWTEFRFSLPRAHFEVPEPNAKLA
jgi:two-component system, OmpR family, heavy metal sensor histidine kinase CusS